MQSGGPERSLELDKFTAVETSGEVDRFISFLDEVEHWPGEPEVRWRSHELLGAAAGDRVVDAGCGTGTAVAELRERGVEAEGIDASEQMVAEARRRHPGGRFGVGSVTSLPFEDGSLAGYRSERVYTHLPDPAAAVAEARRVLAPGGRIVLVDPDFDMLAADAEDLDVGRRIVHAFADSMANALVGRKHRRLLLDAGFTRCEVEVRTLVFTDEPVARSGVSAAARAAAEAGAVTQAEADAWLEDLRTRGREGRFFLALPVVLASAVA